MAVSQREISAQMIAQLRMLDPSVSAEVGTPERKIIDTVAQGLSDAQIDLDGLAVALDIDSKYGAGLDRFLSIFGFARQQATFAKGFVTLGRVSAANVDTRIPTGTRVRAYIDNADGDSEPVDFATLYDYVLPAGVTTVIVPVQCLSAGAVGNVAAYDISEVVGSTLYGITEVFNETPTSGGIDVEDDDQFKVRFKNTVFRNVAGTQDQYLALAIATAYSTKANVVGPQSRYREYIQVPAVDDVSAIDISGDGVPESGNPTGGLGQSGQYTTALSTIPYAKEIWTNIPPFVSNGTEVGSYFFRNKVDFEFNLGANQKNRGDAYRLYKGYPTTELDPASAAASTKPSVTFTNVYSGQNAFVQAARPGDILLLEYTYLSKASRNSLKNNVTNAVDVFVDGGNALSASTIVSPPRPGSPAFVDDATNLYHVENYRRVGYPERRPDVGNILIPLYWQPIVDVPAVIIVDDTTYFEGINYWAVEDVSEIGGTVRARSGIEFSTKERGQKSGDGDSVSTWTGPTIQDGTSTSAIEIIGYTYDKNIADLQASLEGSKQITTDVLAHKSRTRYLKCDFAIMYTQGIPESSANSAIRNSLQNYLSGLYFGSVVQLSDLIQQAHSSSGVDNVRWSSDLPGGDDLARVYQTDIDGKPLCGVNISHWQRGRDAVFPTEVGATPIVARNNIQHMFINGEPEEGNFTITSTSPSTGAKTSLLIDIAPDGVKKTDAQIVDQINAWSGALPANEQFFTTALSYSNANAAVKRRGFSFAYFTNGVKPIIEVTTSNLRGGPFVINNDFFINDDEVASLPLNAYTPISGIADTVPGVITRPRAQNTWIKS